ncbi:MAG: hypothetical protein HYY06_11570 [Deltaproteobacteria bacterium]|nr:hypothetical protein [Deltaproteobacteria bacterium]
MLLLRPDAPVFGGPELAFIAGVVDRLTDASPGLVPAAQVLWVYATFGFVRHVPASCAMHHDIEAGTVRLDEPYGNPMIFHE